MNGLRPVTVITGASAGIGVALARVFARNGHEVALVARREDRLWALADEIAATGACKPLVIVADLQRNDAARVIGEALVAQGAEPQYVVNNAGFGLVGAAASRDRDEQLAMIDLNVRTLTELSLAFVDSLPRRRQRLTGVRLPQPVARAGGRAWLPRPDARAARGHPRSHQQTGHLPDPHYPAAGAADGRGFAAIAAPARAAQIAAIGRACCKHRQSRYS